MEFMVSKAFWGIVVILIGVSIVLNGVFKIDFPVFKVLIALFFIFIGVRILLSSFGVTTQSNIMSDQKVVVNSLENTKYDVVFGSQVIDLTHADLPDNGDVHVECNVVFGSMKVLVPKDMNTKIKSNAVFGSVKSPGGKETSFGSNTYEEGTANTPWLHMEVNAVFGSAEIIER